MGFLSRKSKQADTAVKEQDGIVEELQEMEEAVPEVPTSADVPAAESAGPVTGDGSPSSRDDAAGREPSPAPPAEPAEGKPVETGSTDGGSPEAEVSEPESEPEEDAGEGRM